MCVKLCRATVLDCSTVRWLRSSGKNRKSTSKGSGRFSRRIINSIHENRPGKVSKLAINIARYFDKMKEKGGSNRVEG